ncbi:hypothetical protein LCGC14_2325520 [marine sediment metagenome]|uniref:Uncharacterized protein n=1 Tax=marine sediment metagenome TaxID=412755 RepID=A0A0F9CH45_9ZZZZ
MSFLEYCEKCEMETGHVSKEKLGTDKDACIPCSHREEELKKQQEMK